MHKGFGGDRSFSGEAALWPPSELQAYQRNRAADAKDIPAAAGVRGGLVVSFGCRTCADNESNQGQMGKQKSQTFASGARRW